MSKFEIFFEDVRVQSCDQIITNVEALKIWKIVEVKLIEHLQF